MRRKIVLFIIITICFVLQTTLFKAFAIAGISPNLLIIAVSSFGFMRGKKEGLWIGLFSGLLIDIFLRKLFRCICSNIYVYRFYQWFFPKKILSGWYQASDAPYWRQWSDIQSVCIFYNVSASRQISVLVLS